MKQKIKTIDELKEILEKEKQENKKIVTTNGSFDIIHIAHLHFLEKAKSLGDILVVLVNSDLSVKQNKGNKRPILPEQERAEYLSYLWCVDYVAVFSEKTPIDTLRYLQPNIHVKGGSYIQERVQEEKNLLESWRGEFKTFPLEEGYSTTNLIKEIMESYKDETI